MEMEEDYDDSYGYSDDDQEQEDGDQFENKTKNSPKSFAVLSVEDIKYKQLLAVQSVASTLSTSAEKAVLFLRRYNWDANALANWFEDEQKMRKETGLVEETEFMETGSELILCGICGDKFAWSHTKTALCGLHPYCLVCWKHYTEVAIRDGPGCLSLRCPDPKCSAGITESMVLSLVDKKHAQMYQKFALHSFVEHPKSQIKWCPAPDCVFAIDGFAISGIDPEIVQCNCGHSFCWNCKEQPHRPVNCETVKSWKEKNESESQNTAWLLAYTKQCPRCKKPVEKNQGCMHMSCPPPCGFHFCWFCLGPFVDHGTHICKYNVDEKKKAILSRKEAKLESERYQRCYEHWHANSKSRDLALKILKHVETNLIPALTKKTDLHNNFDILADGWKEVVRCREVYTWSFVYDFYLTGLGSKREFFEHHMNQAGNVLEKLHRFLESDIKLDMEIFDSDKWMSYRHELQSLKNAVTQYFDKLTTFLESGMNEIPDVVPRKSKEELKALQQKMKQTFTYNSMAVEADEDAFLNAHIPTYNGPNEVEELENIQRMYDEPVWICTHCTMANQNLDAQECMMCRLPRDIYVNVNDT